MSLEAWEIGYGCSTLEPSGWTRTSPYDRAIDYAPVAWISRPQTLVGRCEDRLCGRFFAGRNRHEHLTLGQPTARQQATPRGRPRRGPPGDIGRRWRCTALSVRRQNQRTYRPVVPTRAEGGRDRGLVAAAVRRASSVTPGASDAVVRPHIGVGGALPEAEKTTWLPFLGPPALVLAGVNQLVGSSWPRGRGKRLSLDRSDLLPMSPLWTDLLILTGSRGFRTRSQSFGHV